MEDLKDVILDYVIEEYAEEDDDVTYDTPLISGGLVDSFSMVSLKRFLEVRYKISIPDEDATPEAFDSVNKIVVLVKLNSRRIAGLTDVPPVKVPHLHCIRISGAIKSFDNQTQGQEGLFIHPQLVH